MIVIVGRSLIRTKLEHITWNFYLAKDRCSSSTGRKVHLKFYVVQRGAAAPDSL
jgi:hypothetical protein